MLAASVDRWRAFAMEMAEALEQQGGRSVRAYQGALRMVVIADQVLGLLGRSESGLHGADASREPS